jgi:hypothetical protein
MLFTDFIHNWEGQYCDFDGAHGPQCMDLMNRYCVDVLGDTSGQLRAGTAYASYLKGGKDYERFTYAPGMVPQAGDIIYWTDVAVPGTGHVAIVISANEKELTSFDQNWPLRTPSHTQHHSYDGIAGWLRYKKTNPPNKKRMIKLMEHYRCVWKKDASDNGLAEYWVIKTNDQHPLETKHRVRTSKADVASLFGSYGNLERKDWGYLAGLTTGKDFDLNDLAITKPELFESV